MSIRSVPLPLSAQFNARPSNEKHFMRTLSVMSANRCLSLSPLFQLTRVSNKMLINIFSGRLSRRISGVCTRTAHRPIDGELHRKLRVNSMRNCACDTQRALITSLRISFSPKPKIFRRRIRCSEVFSHAAIFSSLSKREKTIAEVAWES